MKLGRYLKDKILFIFLQSLIVWFIILLLNAYNISDSAIIFSSVTVISITIVSLAFEYFVRYRYYKRLNNTLSMMDKKQYISALLEEPDFADAEILCEVIKQTTKAMNDEIASYKIAQDEYREYIETWIHEIKIPISCIDLICKNNKSDTTKRIEEETLRVDNYIEQALFYARSTNVEADYSIKKLNLNTLIKRVVKKHSKQLISCGTRLDFNNLDCIVYGDEKWLDFIIGQIVANSIKYKKDSLELSFSARDNKENIELSIKDNGIGVPQSDLSRVFEKGFTGENGRIYAKSTGIGLYICRTLCEKMYLGLELKSEYGKGTVVKIIFPKDRQCFL